MFNRFTINKIELGKKGSNQYRIRQRRVLGLRYGTWLTILAIILILFIIGCVAYPMEMNKRMVEMLSANTKVYAQTPERDFSDKRVQKLYDYLVFKNSPLAPHAEYIVGVSDENAIDYTLIAAIAGKESSFGKAIKPNSYNAWGIMAWDKYGVRSIRIFDNWNEAIKFEAELLGNHYRANSYAGIQDKYCPDFECSETWTINVTAFSEEINK